MSKKDPKRDGLVSRVTDAIRSFVADGDSDGLEAAARRVVGSVEAWRKGAAMGGFSSVPGRDLLTRVGEPVELSVTIDPIAAATVARVRFFVDGEIVGESKVENEPTAWFRHAPDHAGVFRVTFEVLDRHGVRVATRAGDRHARLQVVEHQPVAMVDATLVLDLSADALRPLRTLEERGWSLCYFDVHENDRTSEVVDAASTKELPDGAVLSHPGTDAGFDTLGFDFGRILAGLTIRRARARGAAVFLVVSDEPDAWDDQDAWGLTQLDVAHLGDDEVLTRQEARAAEFEQTRKGAQRAGWFLDQMTDTRAVDGNTCVVELDNRRAREKVLDAVQSAQKSVHLQVYMLQEGMFTEHLSVRLIERARAGVQVRLLVDALYSGQELLGVLENPVVRVLQDEPNIQTAANDPIRTTDDVDAEHLKARDHRKLIVIDGVRAFVSGRNFGDEYYTGFEEVPVSDFTPHERIPWMDAHVELQGPLVTEVQQAFADAWARNVDPPFERGPDTFPAPQIAGTVRARLVLHDGLSDALSMAAYEALLETATRHVYVMNSFPIHGSLAGSMKSALRRGVRVVLLVGCGVARRADGTFFKGPLHRELFEYLTKHRLEPLIRAGAETYEVATEPLRTIVSRGGVVRPYLHTKVMTADGVVASVGSANLDATASFWEREANVVIEDSQVVGELEAEIERIIARSYRLDLDSEYWKSEARKREVVARLWPGALFG